MKTGTGKKTKASKPTAEAEPTTDEALAASEEDGEPTEASASEAPSKDDAPASVSESAPPSSAAPESAPASAQQGGYGHGYGQHQQQGYAYGQHGYGQAYGQQYHGYGHGYAAVGAARQYSPIEVHEVSRWYGQVIGLSNVWMRVDRGIVGLLGPNGAGKSTLMKILAGLLKPSRGAALIHGKSLWHDSEARRRLGYCPEHEGVYDDLTAREFVTMMAELSGVPGGEARKRAAEALDSVGLKDAMDRRLKGYSKGMRQRAKLAQAFVHNPDVLLLDEPLTGCDPLARAQIVAKIEELAKAGKVIVVSSHVLYEIEALTTEIVMIHRGRVLAEGNVYKIREMIDQHPHRVRVECERPRELAAKLALLEHVVRLTLWEGGVEIETRQPDHLYEAIPRQVLELGVELRSISSPDNNLQAVFEYLTTTWYGPAAGGGGYPGYGQGQQQLPQAGAQR